MTLETRPNVKFLSELYAADVPEAVLLAEYPSSNSKDTRFQNSSKFIIHDPYPPPRLELLKVLGPHHLMCGWGNLIPVCSEIEPPVILVEHWARLFGDDARPTWQAFDEDACYVTLFPHESLSVDQQVVYPAVNYALHSKEVIEKIDCPQADVLKTVTPPCIVKLSHGYAGLGNFFIRNPADEAAMRTELNQHWPNAVLVINSIIENVSGDFGVQFYIHRDGTLVWIGATQQHFNADMKWSGGSFSAELQETLRHDVTEIVEAAGEYLHAQGYTGLVGIDILRDDQGRHYLVDVNPRLTGISPFLMNSRIFADDGLTQGVYRASVAFKGSIEQLIHAAEAVSDARVVVLSAFEEPGSDFTICHLSANAESLSRCETVLNEFTRS